MKIYKTVHLKSALFLIIGILVLQTLPVFAQSQTKEQATSSGDQKQTDTSSSANNTTGNPVSDDMFVQTISEANLAEIELSNMAVEKASSEKVRNYAQMLIKHHTAAQLELSSAISQSMSLQATRNRAGGTSNDANDETDLESPNNAADKTATLGGTGGTTGNSMATGKTNGQYNSNMNSGKAVSQAGTATNTSAPASNNASSTTGSANQNPASQKRYLATELSAEHKALKNKLSVLSGDAFDSQYLQAMVADHAKAVELFEKQALQSSDIYLQAFASKNLPIIKEHHQKAQQLYTDSNTSQKEK